MPYSLFNALHISRTDMLARLQDLDVISNNLANVNTSGFKSNRSEFQELKSTGYMGGVTIPGTQMSMAQGALKTTGNNLDWAIEGAGYFQVQLPNGQTGYTRNGEFHLDKDRTLTTTTGEKLIWQGTIPATFKSVSIQPDGRVLVNHIDGTQTIAGQVRLARFANPTGLLAQGNNILLAGVSSGAAQLGTPGSANYGPTVSGALESSNVDISREMTNMIIDQRTFEMSVKAFQQSDEMIAMAINIRKG
jgi:flagellar basal-body rod protein FlgG